MSRFCSKCHLLGCFRKAFSAAAAAEKAKAQPPPASATMKVAVGGGSKDYVGKAAATVGKEVFWMKDPKSGNWLPETHFDQVDAAELREKLLSKGR